MKDASPTPPDPWIIGLKTPLVGVGYQHRPVDAPGWHTTEVTATEPTVCFSLTPVRVVFDAAPPVILAPATLAITSPLREYVQTPVTEQAQRSLFFIFKDDSLARFAADRDPSAIERPDDPILFETCPADPAASAAAASLARACFATGLTPDPLFIEDAAIAIVARAIDRGYSHLGLKPRPGRYSARTVRAQRDAVNAVCTHINSNAGDRLSLNELSDIADLSPGYLSRIFPAHAGQSLSSYLTATRVIQALHRLPDYRRRLASLAQDSGFASHAHMTATVTSLVGRPPTALQDDELPDLLAHLRQPPA